MAAVMGVCLCLCVLHANSYIQTKVKDAHDDTISPMMSSVRDSGMMSSSAGSLRHNQNISIFLPAQK